MARNNTVYDAEDAFANALARNVPRLFAIIVTQGGNATEKPLGVVTPWDLLNQTG